MTDRRRVKTERYTQKQFEALVRKDPDCLYFIVDNRRIYMGNVLFAEGFLKFTNTGSGWRVEKDDGTRFVHTDNDSIVDPADHVLIVSRDTQDEETHNDLGVGPDWKTIFSSEDSRLEYELDPRLVIDSTGGGRVSADLIVDTDDPKTPLETHLIEHLAVDKGPGYDEYDLSKYNLKGKTWRIAIRSRTLWPVKLLAFRWGHTGGFLTELHLDYEPETNDIVLQGIDGYELDRVSLDVFHDHGITGDGSKNDPLRVVGFDYAYGTPNVESITAAQLPEGVAVSVTKGAAGVTSSTSAFNVTSQDLTFKLGASGLEISSKGVHTDKSLKGTGAREDPLGVVSTSEIGTLSGEFRFKDGSIEFWRDGATQPIKIGKIDLSEAVDDYSIHFEGGVLRGEAFVYWDQEKTPIKFRRAVTQVQYDQLITDDAVEEDTVYFTTDTLRIYIGELLYTKDYTEGGELPIMYDTTWVPQYPQWQPRKFYQTNTMRMYDEKYYRCVNSHMATDDFDPSKWEEFEAPEETQIRRQINEGPNDFQIAFMRYVAEYPVNEHWMTEHTFNFRIVADPDDPKNPRGHAQFLVDNEEITFRPGDYVRTDGQDQTVAGIKQFTGDLRILDYPPTLESAINSNYLNVRIQAVIDDYTAKFAEAWARIDLLAEQTELDRVEEYVRNKSDKWWANWKERDVGDLEIGSKALIIRFPKNPKVDADSWLKLQHHDGGTTYELRSHDYREYLAVNDKEIEFFNDGTETWAESWSFRGAEYDRDRREIRFYTVVTVQSLDQDWKAKWGSRDIQAVEPRRPVVDCRFNYERILELQDRDRYLEKLIRDEIARAIAAEDDLQDQLTSEVTRATDREDDIEEQLIGETSRAESEEGRLEDLITTEETRAKAEEKRIEDESKARDLQNKGDLTAEIARVERESKDRDEQETAERIFEDEALQADVNLRLIESDFDEWRVEMGEVLTDVVLEGDPKKEWANLNYEVTNFTSPDQRATKTVHLYSSDDSLVFEKTVDGLDIRVFDLFPDLPDAPIGEKAGRWILKLTKELNSPSYTWLPVTQDMWIIQDDDELEPVNMRPGTVPKPDRDGRFALGYIRGLDGYTDGLYWVPVREDLNTERGDEILTDWTDRGLNTPDYPEDLYGKWALVVTQKGTKAFLVWEPIVDTLYLEGKKATAMVLPEFPMGDGDWVLAFSRHGTNETLYWADADRNVG
jgi:hypothetical protein